MDDVLSEFLAEAATAGFTLDYSLDSLDILERFVISRSDEAVTDRFRNRAARYLGEIFRKEVGGKWELCLKSPRYLYFGLPVLSGYSDRPIEFCPIEILGNFTLNKEPGLLKRAVESHSKFKR